MMKTMHPWCSCPSLIATLLTWKPSWKPPLVVGIHSPLKTSSLRILSSWTSDSCRLTVTPSWARKTLLFSHWSPTVKGRKETHLGRTLSASIVTRRVILPATAMALAEPRRGSSPPEDTLLRQIIMPPMQLPVCWMALGPQLHLNLHFSSPLTLNYQPHMTKWTPTSKRCPRMLVTPKFHWNPQCYHTLHPPPPMQIMSPQSSMTLELPGT